MPPTNPSTGLRIMSVAAATVIALACGTNYVYSAWAPQFATRLKLSSTESNLIGTFGNLGMYASGIPFGMVVDSKGPRWGVAVGVVLFALGYYPLAKAFDAGPGSFHVAVLCLFSFFTGAGSSSAFSAAIKAAALNFPEARGTATAFPFAAFGLSAFFFATVALAFPHDTPHFLLLLATGTVVLPVLSFPFLRTVKTGGYQSVSSGRAADSGFESELELSKLERDDEDVSSLLSDEDEDDGTAGTGAVKTNRASRRTEDSELDIRGFALLRHIEFWQLFGMLGLLAGIGLMTINNIGNDVQALWRSHDPNVLDAFIAKRQVAHVSTLSVCSFAGRLMSGIGSDILVNKYNRSRKWCLFASATLFALAQLMAVFIEDPDTLILVSGITGIAYGTLFGVYASLVAHAFGINGLSQNWGTMCLAPMMSGQVFNILYGRIYDGNSDVDQDGNRLCVLGRECYSKAYLVTWLASLIGLALCAWSIWHEDRVWKIKTSAHHRTA